MKKASLVFTLSLGFFLTVLAGEPQRVAGLTTTTPVTQDRDKAYIWADRHLAVLARNRIVKPDVVIIGDSIIHFWSGEPAAPRVWGGTAWADCFQGYQVTNLGFGWDRTENVLWRLDHGELDDIHPRVIIIKIGTNNTSVNNSPTDIAAGIEAVCATAHAKVPTAKILLLGILPRHDEKPGQSATRPVNELLKSHLAGVPYLTFADFDAAFRQPAGEVDPALFMDGVHVNAQGYAILGAKIRAQLVALAP